MKYSLNYNPQELGKRIKSLRHINNMTQEQLAEALMVSVDSITNYENGRTNCMHDHIIHICELFNVSTDYLFLGEVKTEAVGESNNLELIIKKLSKLEKKETEKIIKVLDILY